MEIWAKDIKTGVECGINNDGNLFIGNDTSGSNASDTPENREMIKREFKRYTGIDVEAAISFNENKAEVDQNGTRFYYSRILRTNKPDLFGIYCKPECKIEGWTHSYKLIAKYKDESSCTKELKNIIEGKINDLGGLAFEGHQGTFYVIDTVEVNGFKYYILESEIYGDEAFYLAVDEYFSLVMDGLTQDDYVTELNEHFNG